MPKEVVTQTNIMIFSTECNKISLIIIFNTYSESQVLDSLLTNSYMSAGYWVYSHQKFNEVKSLKASISLDLHNERLS